MHTGRRCAAVLGSVIAMMGLGVVACGSAPLESTSEDEIGSSSSGSSGASGSSGSSGIIGSSSGASGSSGTSGSSGSNCAGTTAETKKAPVDIIFTIDNSGSMDAELTQIKANVNSFAAKIGKSGLDYHVIFIVAKSKNAADNNKFAVCVPAPLAGADCADNLPTFAHIPQSVASTNGTALILSTYDSTDAKLSWKKHLREEATKVFIMITDDRSSTTAENFDAQLLAKQPAGMFGTAAARKYIYHSIVSWKEGTTPPSSSLCQGAAGESTEHQKLSLLTKGIIDSVCKTDYSNVLDNISKNVVDRLACDLTLQTSGAIDPTKVVVQTTPTGGQPKVLTQVTGADKCASVPDAWHYDNNEKPTKVILCKSTCDAINGTSQKVEAKVGCSAPPPK
jgi:hypothetical protein